MLNRSGLDTGLRELRSGAGEVGRQVFVGCGSLRCGSRYMGGVSGEGESVEEEERVSGMSPNAVTYNYLYLYCGIYHVTVFQSDELNTEHVGKGSLLVGRRRRSHLPLLASVSP